MLLIQSRSFLFSYVKNINQWVLKWICYDTKYEITNAEWTCIKQMVELINLQ